MSTQDPWEIIDQAVHKKSVLLIHQAFHLSLTSKVIYFGILHLKVPVSDSNDSKN